MELQALWQQVGAQGPSQITPQEMPFCCPAAQAYILRHRVGTAARLHPQAEGGTLAGASSRAVSPIPLSPRVWGIGL